MGGGGGGGEGNLEEFGCVPKIYLPDPTKALKYNLMTPPLNSQLSPHTSLVVNFLQSQANKDGVHYELQMTNTKKN